MIIGDRLLIAYGVTLGAQMKGLCAPLRKLSIKSLVIHCQAP
jgi:hypothetical protein